MDLHLVIAGGLFSLGGVILGGLLTPLTQLFLERLRERRAVYRAKLLVAAELLQAQSILGNAIEGRSWPPFEDVDAYMPTSAWRENRSSIAGNVSEDLWVKLVMAYQILEFDRERIAFENKKPTPQTITAEEAKAMKGSYYKLGRLRSQLGVGGGWLDELEDKAKLEP